MQGVRIDIGEPGSLVGGLVSVVGRLTMHAVSYRQKQSQ